MLQKQTYVRPAQNNIIVLNNLKNPNEITCSVNVLVEMEWWLKFGYSFNEIDCLDVKERFEIITKRTPMWDHIRYNHMQVDMLECWDDAGDDVYNLEIKMNWLLVMGEDITELNFFDKSNYIKDFFGDLGLTGTLMAISSNHLN